MHHTKTKKDMKNTNLTTKRTLMLDLMKIGKTLSPYDYAMGLMTSLKTNKIDNYEYYCLMTMFEMYCEVENIKTAF